jgi:hypothetical protein
MESADEEDINWSMYDECNSNDESIISFDDTDVAWRTSGAQEILLNDLQGGTLTFDAEVLSAEEAWESVYKDMSAFELVPFSQFKRQLKAHRGQVQKLVSKSTAQYDAFCQDQATQQHHTHYQDGCPIFAAFPAGKLLMLVDETGP